jgi:hypothetical protein
MNCVFDDVMIFQNLYRPSSCRRTVVLLKSSSPNFFFHKIHYAAGKRGGKKESFGIDYCTR